MDPHYYRLLLLLLYIYIFFFCVHPICSRLICEIGKNGCAKKCNSSFRIQTNRSIWPKRRLSATAALTDRSRVQRSCKPVWSATDWLASCRSIAVEACGSSGGCAGAAGNAGWTTHPKQRSLIWHTPSGDSFDALDVNK